MTEVEKSVRGLIKKTKMTKRTRDILLELVANSGGFTGSLAERCSEDIGLEVSRLCKTDMNIKLEDIGSPFIFSSYSFPDNKITGKGKRTYYIGIGKRGCGYDIYYG